MQVALLSCNAQARNAIGNQVAEKLAFFRERGADVRVFLQSLGNLHSALRPYAHQVDQVAAHGPVWDWLSQADLVIADYAQFHELLHYLPLLVGQRPRLVFDYHGVTPARFWEGPQRELMERSARQRGLVWCADVALAHSQFAKDELQRATGFPSERIVVQPYPTDSALFQPGSCEPLRQRLGLGAGPVLLYVGRLAASKRVPLLIETLPLLPDAQLVIVGDCNDVYAVEVRRCQELAQRLNVTDRIRFLGQVDDVALADLYRGADVLVMPSLHEGYCLPAIEAMSSGLPVIAARATALPETIGDAGLSFTPDDALDLARQVRRLFPTAACGLADITIAKPQAAMRVAIVSFRFGSQIVGGAETSLRTIANTLQRGGLQVEIFTTCNNHESAWANDLPPGTSKLDGLTVHRFPIDPHDRAAHHDTIRQIVEAKGQVDAATTEAYLRHSLHSTALMAALGQRQAEFDAVIVGPYLFGLTHDVARAFPDQTLLLPCFHDEPFVRLRCWPEAYTVVGGMLYHSPEEQEFAQSVLGLNHPRAVEIGTVIDLDAFPRAAARGLTERSIVYCGRYSRQKNVPLLLEFAERYQRERPERHPFVFLGEGEVRIPQAAWASDRGRVTEEQKRRLLANAAALVQLSTQESLSLVALEAWAQGTPVIAHRDCAVLRGQIERAQGGRTIADYADFAQALDELWDQPDIWQVRGENGRAYVEARYGSEEGFRQRLLDAIAGLHVPLREQMRRRGLQQAALRDRPSWRAQFGQFIERVLDDEPSLRLGDIEVQPQATQCRANRGSRSTLFPVRVVNHGTLPALTDGPARTELVAEIIERVTGKPIGAPCRTELPGLVLPGHTLPAAMVVMLPQEPGEYQFVLRAECRSDAIQRPRQREVPLMVGDGSPIVDSLHTGSFLESIQATMAEVHRLQRLPDDYEDVTEGKFARWKRWLKQKLLGNFKKAYVDVLSHQQSQVNQHLLMTVQQLAEYCATLEHAVQGLRQRAEKDVVREPCPVQDSEPMKTCKEAP